MPPGRSSSLQKDSSTTIQFKNLEKEIDKKADDTLTKTMFEVHEKDIAEVKEIALSAKKHKCVQEGRMEKIEGKSTGWSKTFRNLVVAAIGVAFLIGGYFVKIEVTKADASEVQAVQKNMTILKSDMSEVKASQKRIEQKMEPEAQLELEKQRVELMKEAMQEVLEEKKEPKGRRRTH